MSGSGTAPALVLGEAVVVRRTRVSGAFVRFELGGPCMADAGVDGPLLDQRFKLVFPSASGALPPLAGFGADWRRAWLDLPADQQGFMRTYTVREFLGHGDDTRLVVDVVVHGDPDDDAVGPGARWGATAGPGDRVAVVAPRRGHTAGIEFAAPAAARVLLAADETAAPAVFGILRDLPADGRGAAFVEVPHDDDVLDDLVGPPGVAVHWLPRNGTALGHRLQAAVAAHVGAPVDDPIAVADHEIDDELWETPVSPSGPAVDGPAAAGHDLDRLYAWIAGESGVVTGLRRHLTREAGLDRRQVAFMGYWRRGVAMRG